MDNARLLWHGKQSDERGSVAQADEEPISHGGFADIYRGTWDYNGVSQLVALKKLKKVIARDDRPIDLVKLLDRLKKEVAVWSELDHPNILPLYGIAVRDDIPAMVSPFMRNGDAMGYLKTHREADRLKMLIGLASALDYLHTLPPGQGGSNRTMVHGDVRGDNVLVDSEGDVKLADFGMARIYVIPGEAELNTYSLSVNSLATMGNDRFTAPELLFGENVVRKTMANDVFAFGIVVYQFYAMTIPFPDVSYARFAVLLSNGERPTRPPVCPEAVWSLAMRCAAQDPNARPNMHQVHAELSVLSRPTPA